MFDAENYTPKGQDRSVRYRDSGAGVFLDWDKERPTQVDILSADRERILGNFTLEGAPYTPEEASAALRAEINTPGKPYGEKAALWTAGDWAIDDLEEDLW